MILVVGGTGVVGRAVLLACDRAGLAAVGIARRPREGSGVEAGDARLPDLGLPRARADQLRGEVTHVVFAAGRADLDTTVDAVLDDHVSAVEGALAFHATCRVGTRFVLVSSIAAVGDARIRIASSFAPDAGRFPTIYGWGKAMCERSVRPLGPAALVVRPGHVVDDLGGADADTPIGILAAIPTLVSGWPHPIAHSGRYWCAPASYVGELIVAAMLDPGINSLWAVDPASPTLARLVEHTCARHGFPSKRLVGRAATLALGVLRTGVGAAIPPSVLAYLDQDLDLDLRCLEKVQAAAALEPPGDRTYLTEAVDRVVRRHREQL